MTYVDNKRGEAMARPRKHRRVCSRPRCTSFRPCEGSGELISMTFDEYEAIRLIDFEELTQEQCAELMEVARTTVQSIYGSARKKLAQCIVLGQSLQISGGDVRFCEHHNPSCGKNCCRRENSLNGKEETNIE